MESIQRKICTGDNPMPEESEGYWQHIDAKETDYDGEYYIEMKCPHCKLVFTTEMSD